MSYSERLRADVSGLPLTGPTGCGSVDDAEMQSKRTAPTCQVVGSTSSIWLGTKLDLWNRYYYYYNDDVDRLLPCWNAYQRRPRVNTFKSIPELLTKQASTVSKSWWKQLLRLVRTGGRSRTTNVLQLN